MAKFSIDEEEYNAHRPTSDCLKGFQMVRYYFLGLPHTSSRNPKETKHIRGCSYCKQGLDRYGRDIERMDEEKVLDPNDAID